LTAQHVSSVIITHRQELLNCNYSFWFYSHLSFRSSWWWAIITLKTCWAVKEQWN